MSRSLKISFVVMAALIVAAVFGSIIYNEKETVKAARQLWSEAKTMDDCELRLTSALNEQQRANIPIRNDMSRYCFSHAVRQGQLIDFSVSRTIYAEQSYETQVLLWMVVAITLSGVILAGVQIVAAYKLSSVAKVAPDLGGKLDFDKSGKLSVQSSVTGLLILIVSFAFFIVYVRFVYPLDHRFLDPADKAAGETEASLEPQKPLVQAGVPVNGTNAAAAGRQYVAGGLGGAPAARSYTQGGLGEPPAATPGPVLKNTAYPASAAVAGASKTVAHQ